MSSPANLTDLRNELDEVDRSLIAAIAKRQDLVAAIGKLKQHQGRQLRDFRREREVLANVRARAEALNLDGALAERVLKLLIESSLTAQEQQRVRSSAASEPRRALVLGGNGKMGRWFVQFLDAQGFEVVVADPSGAPDGYQACVDWQSVAQSAEVIVLAAQLRATPELLRTLTALRPSGLVFDLGSLKSPLAPALREAAAAGLKICSLHPMFGPDTVLLSDRHVIFVDLGRADAVAEAKALFAATSAELVDMGLDEHDELIAYVLGLSHALNIAFFTALANSGESAPKLARLSSTTFDRQLAIAASVSAENPRLYFEIQHLNVHRDKALGALERALAEVARCVREGDEFAFVGLMERGRGYLAARSR